MNLLGISAIICMVVVVAGITMVNAISIEEEQEVLQSCGTRCGNICGVQNNCGLSTCGAISGGSCDCGK